MRHFIKAVSIVALFTLSACGGGGDNNSNTSTSAVPEAPVISYTMTTKQINFSWSTVPGATSYRLYQNPDGVAGYSQVGSDLPATATSVSVEVPIHLLDWVNLRFIVEACSELGCSASSEITGLDHLAAIGTMAGSNAEQRDLHGYSIALSGDGDTLAIGAYGEGSNGRGVNSGAEADNSALYSGAVYVFVRNNDNTWSQQAYIKASNADSGDRFGSSVALSVDGNTLAVGAHYEDGAGVGVNPNTQNDNTAQDSGAVYVFTRQNSSWSQQAYIKASNTDMGDWFGQSVALSGDGNTLAVGAEKEDSSATGVNSGIDNVIAGDSGAVYVFERNTSTWTQSAYIKASNTDAYDRFGISVDLSGDGNTLAVGAYWEDSGYSGVNPTIQTDNSKQDSGAVYVFVRSAGNWSQQAYIKALYPGNRDHFGASVALNDNGNTLAVGAYWEDSSATGVNSALIINDLATDSGAAYVFERSNNSWTLQAQIKASNTTYIIDAAGAEFGRSLSLSGDGNTLVVGAYLEDSSGSGVNPGTETDISYTTRNSGAVYLYRRSNNSWIHQAYIKNLNAFSFDKFGTVALSDDAYTLAVGSVGLGLEAVYLY